jgi:hypothetical protein
MRPSYSINPSLRKRFLKKLTPDRVVPIISARVAAKSWESAVPVRPAFQTPSHQQQNPRQPPLAGVEELIDQIGWMRILQASSACGPGGSIEGLNRLLGSAEPLLQIDMKQELQQLRQEDSWQRETGGVQKRFAKYPGFRIVVILKEFGRL